MFLCEHTCKLLIVVCTFYTYQESKQIVYWWKEANWFIGYCMENNGKKLSRKVHVWLILLACRYFSFSMLATHFVAFLVLICQSLKVKIDGYIDLNLFHAKILDQAFHLMYNLSLLFTTCIYILAPEAVTNLNYEQIYGIDNRIKICIKWMVSSLSKS